MNLFVISVPNEQQRKIRIRQFEMGVMKKSFCWRANLSNDNIISAYARSENGYRV